MSQERMRSDGELGEALKDTAEAIRDKGGH